MSIYVYLFKTIQLTKLFIFALTSKCPYWITSTKASLGNFTQIMTMNASEAEQWRRTVMKKETTMTKRGRKIMISMLLEEVKGLPLQIV